MILGNRETNRILCPENKECGTAFVRVSLTHELLFLAPHTIHTLSSFIVFTYSALKRLESWNVQQFKEDLPDNKVFFPSYKSYKEQCARG